jgi:hypothetical protein
MACGENKASMTYPSKQSRDPGKPRKKRTVAERVGNGRRSTATVAKFIEAKTT